MKKNNLMYQNVERCVVEVSKPQKGQILSSGGVRENGRIVAQYKNPVPYKETITHTNYYYIQRDAREEMKEQLKHDMAKAALDLGLEIAVSLWDERLKHVCVEVIDVFVDTIKGKNTKVKEPSNALKIKATKIIEQKNMETKHDMDGNIVYFPKKKIV